MEIGRFLPPALAITAALKEVHQSGLIHKDIKPYNIVASEITDSLAVSVRRSLAMSVYAIAQLWIHDPVTYGRYVARFMDVFKNYKGRVLVADESPVVLEGAWDGNKVVVVSFPDETSFRDWAESQEYLEIATDRKAGARSVIVLVKGIPSRTEVAKSG